MAKKYLKRCSMSLAIREMQIKMTVRYNFISIRLARIRKSGNNQVLVHCRWECELEE